MATKTKRKPQPTSEPKLWGLTPRNPGNGKYAAFFHDPLELEALVRRFPHAVKGTFYTMPCFDHRRGQGIDDPLSLDLAFATPLGDVVSGENAARTLNALHSLSRMKNLPEHNFFVLSK